MDTQTIAIIVAAGRGERAADGADTPPKQYQLIGGQAMLALTLEPFLDDPRIDNVRW